jgi:hypothetical protein
MKVADLFEARKKRKKKSAGFWWGGVPFAIVQSGTGDDTVSYGAGITGGDLSEEEQKEWLLPKGWVMTHAKRLPFNHDVYHITRLMDDKVAAVAGIMDTNDGLEGKWYLYTPNPDPQHLDMKIGKSNQDDMLKFKWWVTNQMVKVGILKPEDLKHAR